MSNTRRLLRGETPWTEPSVDTFIPGDDLYLEECPDGTITAEPINPEVVVIPVFARPHSDIDWGSVDLGAEILTGDVPETMTMSSYERTQAEYNGTNTGDGPVFDLSTADPIYPPEFL
jgi:hypothetical protein